MEEATTLAGTQGNMLDTKNKVVMDVRNITKSLPLGREKIEILKGISFQIMSGEFISIVGPSGSGKSTLLGIIAGLDNPSSGQVLIDGVDITRMSEGQLALGFEHAGRGRYASATSASRRGLGTISDAFTTIVRAANQIATSTVALTQDAKTLAETAQLQTDGLRTTAADAEELKQIANQNALSAERAGILVGEAKQAAQAAIAVSNRLVGAVSELEATSKSVAAFTVLINDIAARTNLLALNASVEAARAGESGNGFRVVAEEVRALAVKSAAASKDVSATIKQSGDRIRTGVGLAGEMRTVLETIVKSVDSV